MKISNKCTIEDKHIDMAERFFLLLFFIYAFLGNNSFTYGSKIITCVMWVTFLLGGGLLLYRLIHFKSYYQMPGAIFLLFMLASMGISILANYQYAFKENVIYAIYWVFYFALLYVQRTDLTLEAFLKRFNFVAALFIIYMTVGVIASYVLMITGYNGVFYAPDTNFEYRLGFSIGRLWGVFINPNGAAFAAATAAALLFYFIVKFQKRWVRILCGVDILVLMFYVALSDSRSGAICFGVMLAVLSFVMLWYKNEEKKWTFRGMSMLAVAVILVSGIYAPRLLKDAYNQVVILTASKENPGKELENSEFVVERGYDVSDDISNRRFDIWKSAVEIYTSSPKTMLLGTSFRGIVPYAKEYLPDTYIVNNDSSTFETMENEFFNILVAQGTLGILTVIAFGAFLLMFIFKRIFRLKREYRSLAAILLSVVLGEGAICMLSALVFYHFSQCTIIFWFSLGGLIFVLKQGEEKQNGIASD